MNDHEPKWDELDENTNFEEFLKALRNRSKHRLDRVYDDDQIEALLKIDVDDVSISSVPDWFTNTSTDYVSNPPAQAIQDAQFVHDADIYLRSLAFPDFDPDLESFCLFSLGYRYAALEALAHAPGLPAQFASEKRLVLKTLVGKTSQDAIRQVEMKKKRKRGRGEKAKKKTQNRNAKLCEFGQMLKEKGATDASLSRLTIEEFDRLGYWRRFKWTRLSQRQVSAILIDGGVKTQK